MSIEKHIRCECAKYWGMKNHKRRCKRCKTEVISRGKKMSVSKKQKLLKGVENMIAQGVKDKGRTKPPSMIKNRGRTFKVEL